jgi:hypothetical protein
MMLRAIFIDKNIRISKTDRIEKGAIMNEGTRNQLDTKLMEMLDHLVQAKAKKRKPTTQSGTGNIIRRRAGEKEKRFSTCT